MITVEKPNVEVIKGHKFTNVSERNKKASKEIQRAITAYKTMVNREAYYAANFIPHSFLTKNNNL